MRREKKERDWGNVSEQMADVILAQGEKFLDSQLKAGLEGDKRAISAANILVGFATAIVGGGIAYFSAGKLAAVQMLIAAIISGGFLYAAACAAFWCARPVDFYYPGSHPNEWYACRRAKLSQALIGEAQNYQERIEQNEKALTANAEQIRLAARLALCAPVFGLISWIITYVFF